MVYDINLKYNPELLRELRREELKEMLSVAQARHLDLRHQSSPHGRVKLVRWPHLHKKIKKDIARIKTILLEGFG